jgi:hypothetical protein
MMIPSGEDKLLSLLTEIHSDIQQIKAELQSLLTVLKQQQKPAFASSSSSDDTRETIESAQSGSTERRPSATGEKREGRMIRENERGKY